MKQLFTSKLIIIIGFTLVVSLLFNVFFLYKTHKQYQEEEIATVSKFFDNYRKTESLLNALNDLPPFSNQTRSDYQFYINQALSLLTANENIIWIKTKIFPEYVRSFNNNEAFELFSIQISINNNRDVKKALDNCKKILKNIQLYVTTPSYNQEPQKNLEKMNNVLEKNNKKWH
jgi:hypothetical protein